MTTVDVGTTRKQRLLKMVLPSKRARRPVGFGTWEPGPNELRSAPFECAKAKGNGDSRDII